MIGMSMCSGIGAPEVAAPWVDWRLASEIEAFPRAVLQERFGYRLPADHNQGEPLLWGDMTEVSPELMRARGIPLPEIVVAGTPCQAFSVAGLRKGTEDARGNLTLKFVEILHELVAARPDGKLAVLWENVPGVLSDKGNAFGCFLGGLVGSLDALRAPGGGSWPGEGMVQGPRARAAWAVLDAQHFGVAQRRRRVFVVVDFGGAVDPAAVLLEPESLRGHPPARGSKGEVAPTIPSRSTGGGGLGADFDCDGGLIARQWPAEIAPTLNAAFGDKQGLEDQHALNGAGLFVPGPTHALRGEGFDASEDGTGRGTPIVPVAFSSKDYGADAMYDLCPTLRAGVHNESHANAGVPPGIAYAIQERAVCENPKAGPDGAGFRADDAAYTLEARTVPQAVSYQPKKGERHASASEADAGTLLRGVREAIGEEAFAEWVLGILDTLQPPEILRQALHGVELRPAAFTGRWLVRLASPCPADRAAGAMQSLRDAAGARCAPQGPRLSEQRSIELGAYLSKLSQPGASAERLLHDLRGATQGLGLLRQALSAVQEIRRSAGDEGQPAHPGWAVRRLTVDECCFLQGFPRRHTAITYRGKPAADGPQYKALGNSMAVPVISWIMERIRISMNLNAERTAA